MNITRPQKLIYDMEKFAGGAIAIICGSMLVNGRKDLSEIKKAVNGLYGLNPGLRIRISETDGKVSQEICDYAEQEFKMLCFKNKAELDAYAGDYARKPLDLYGNLCEINIVSLPQRYGLLIKLHHIIGDAWTLSLLGTQFCKLMNGEVVEAYSYADYVEGENGYLQSKRYEKDKAFFLEQFKKCDEVTYLSDRQSNSFKAFRKTFVIAKDQTRRINAYARRQGTSAFVLFTTALAAYMNRVLMNTERFYVGTAVLNRNGVKENNTVGMFVNTVPMLMALDNNGSFAENLSAVEATAFSVFRHQKCNYGEILSAIRRTFHFTEKLYDVMISYQNATVSGENIETTWYHSGWQSESLQIHIDDRDREEIFRIHYDYQIDKFTENEIDRIHQHICNLLFDAIHNDTKKLCELQILSADEEQKLLYEFNNTAADYPRDKCVHQLFEEQAARTPHRIGVIACDKTLTYAEINRQANRIAHGLMERGIGVGDIVAFALPRRSYLIPAMLGILKAGGAYLPVDPDYPRERIHYMLEDSEAKLFITEEVLQELLENRDNTNPQVKTSSDHLCYCIYTSGSTGKPKGTLLRHRSVVNYVNNSNHNVVSKIIQPEHKRMVSITTVGFDIFVTESLLPLVNGMEILLANEEQGKLQRKLNELLGNYPADVLQTTPTRLRSLIADKENLDYLKALKVIILGGEAVEEALVRELRLYTDAKIFNIYGPTETTVWSTTTEILKNEEITIGKPIANTQIYITDKYMQLTPLGATGELCIAGDGIGAGYLHRPELTAQKFVKNPFGEGNLYKTGDLAYWREDGNIAYVGRNDFQVKIRGLRIELGEIENAVCSIDGISQAVVVVRKNKEGRQLLCAFYTGEEVDGRDIRRHMGRKLPKYMLPHVCMHLDEMPLTSSGKIDRKALPEIDLGNPAKDVQYVAPATQMQKELCKLYEAVLGTTPIGIGDDFFDMGGDSLKAIELVSRAHNQGICFDLQRVFDHPTVKELSLCVENGDRQEISFENVDFTEVNRVLEKNRAEHIATPQKRDVGNILLAGATGYLGIHILADFLDNDSGIAYCLVRGRDKEDSTERLHQLLTFYFGRKYPLTDRIEVICADLQKDKFGLRDTEYNDLLCKADTVINCAASVKHYGSYKYFYEANVETVKRLIAFCKEGGSKLIHTSTMSVSGNSFGDDFRGNGLGEEMHFSEATLYIGQPLDNVYARSKFEGEKAVLEAVAQGLQANIMRLGQLTNRFADGTFQKNHESNAYLKRFRAMLEIGVIPENLCCQYTEFTPVDKAAEAIMTITRHFSREQTVFHIENHKFLLMQDVVSLFTELSYPVEIISVEEFAELLRDLSKDTTKSHVLEAFINEIDENNRLSYESNVHIHLDFTVDYLGMLGFEWPDIEIDYLRKYIAYFRRIGYLS